MIRYRCEKCGSTLSVAEEGEKCDNGLMTKLFRTAKACGIFPHNWRRLRLEEVREKQNS